jgi:hypothetical protein
MIKKYVLTGFLFNEWLSLLLVSDISLRFHVFVFVTKML